MARDAIIALAGVGIGGLVTIVGNLVQTRYHELRSRKALAGSLAGEIEGIIRAVERRNYIDGLDRIIQRQREVRQRTAAAPGQQSLVQAPIRITFPAFGVRISFNYFSVFDKACDKIGVLGDISGEVALFYTLAKGIVEDLNSLREGVQFLSVDEVIDFHQRLRDLLAEQLARGRQVADRLRKIQDRKFLCLFG